MKEDLLEGFFNRRELKKNEKAIKKAYKEPYIDHEHMRDLQSHNKRLHNIEYEERMAKVEKLEDKLNKLQDKKGIINKLKRLNTYDNLERHTKKADEHKYKMDQADHNINYHQDKHLQQDKAKMFANEFERHKEKQREEHE